MVIIDGFFNALFVHVKLAYHEGVNKNQSGGVYMKVLVRVLSGVAVIVGVLIIIGLFLPNTAHVERRITIQASPSAVFSVINDIKAFNLWSPWARIDPDTDIRQGIVRGLQS